MHVILSVYSVHYLNSKDNRGKSRKPIHWAVQKRFMKTPVEDILLSFHKHRTVELHTSQSRLYSKVFINSAILCPYAI